MLQSLARSCSLGLRFLVGRTLLLAESLNLEQLFHLSDRDTAPVALESHVGARRWGLTTPNDRELTRWSDMYVNWYFSPYFTVLDAIEVSLQDHEHIPHDHVIATDGSRSAGGGYGPRSLSGHRVADLPKTTEQPLSHVRRHIILCDDSTQI